MLRVTVRLDAPSEPLAARPLTYRDAPSKARIGMLMHLPENDPEAFRRDPRPEGFAAVRLSLA
jgi:hypothetical protein